MSYKLESTASPEVMQLVSWFMLLKMLRLALICLPSRARDSLRNSPRRECHVFKAMVKQTMLTRVGPARLVVNVVNLTMAFNT